MQIKIKNKDYIGNYQDGIHTVEELLVLHNSSIDGIKKDRDLRKEIMTILRKNSQLTLGEIGRLCGGYSPAGVSRILNGK